MSLITWITDSHFTNNPPEKRIDNLYTTQFDKYAEFVDYTNKWNAQAFHGGDFTDYHRPPLNFLNKLNEITAKFKRKPKCVIGNHDIIGYNLNSYKDCAIGNFVSSDLAEIAENFTFKPSPGVVDAAHRIIVFHFTPNHTLDMYKNIEPYDGNTIIFSHNMIVKSPVPYPHILAEDVLKVLSENTLILSGHYHIPFDVKSGTRRIINPGSYLRFERMQSNKRKPLIIRVDTATLEVVKHEVVCATDPELIFESLAEMPVEVLPEALSLENLKLHLENVDLQQSKNLKDIITILAGKMEIEKDVLDRALTSIQLAEEEFLCLKK